MSNKSFPFRDPAITTLRMVAMILIVITHLALYYDFAALRHVSRLGTPLFFMMSGYLYGQRSINNWAKFYYRRWRTLIVPTYIWICVISLIGFFSLSYHFTVWQYLTHLFNLCGLVNLASFEQSFTHYIFSIGGCLKPIPGLEHLWFMTLLMICLFFIPCLQKIRIKFSNSSFWFGGWTPVCMMFVACCMLACCGVNTWNIFVFVIGYFVNKKMRPRSISTVVAVIILMIASGIGIYIGRICIESNDLYYNGFYQIPQMIIVCGILGLTLLMFHTFPDMKGLPNVGNYTYCIYITHFIFLFGPFSVTNWLNSSPILAIGVFLCATILSALFLKILTGWVDRALSR